MIPLAQKAGGIVVSDLGAIRFSLREVAMTLCFPPGADWEVEYSTEKLAEMRADPAVAAKMEKSEALAWVTLAILSADRVGVCPVTVRPCAKACPPQGTWTEAPASGLSSVLAGRSSFNPHMNAQGQWVNGCGCSSGCGCESLSEVILPGPVGRIESVYLHGVLLDPSTYRVDSGNRLVSLVEDRPWPSWQNLMQDARGDEAFSVTYYRGTAPSDLVFMAAGFLAVEFFKNMVGGKCRLPAGVRSVTRQGVSYEIQASMFEDGRTGLREVDALLASINPHSLKVRPVVMSPDSPTFRRMF